MAYPQIFLKQCDYAQVTQNKSGDLAMVYKPLQNLVKDSALGHFTTENLKFDRYTQQDMLILDEFDGSTNILLNDDQENPKLINSGFSVQEDNTFLIPEHYTNSVSNIYEDATLSQDTQLFKLYDTIPKLQFLGLGEGGFKCGSYVFYFRLSDSVGNMSNIVAHSNTVQIFIGENGTYQIRMGMQDEEAGKSVDFKLTNLSSGFDYIRVFYERTSSSSDQAAQTQFYMIDQNFPVINGECMIHLTGVEQTLAISLPDLKTEYADIASCKTHACVDNTLFLANTSGFVHDYKALQKLAWCIYPTQQETGFGLPDTFGTTSDKEVAKGYYDPKQTYYNIGYWPDEYYRFGVVFIYNNNQLSPVFNIQGYDSQKTTDLDKQQLRALLWNKHKNKYEFFDSEEDNYIFNNSILSNSKGVFKFNKSNSVTQSVSVCFDTEGIDQYIRYTQDLRDFEKKQFEIDEGQKYDIKKFLNQYHGIKGFFFVRQKRIPSILAQGLVIGLTKKEHGCIPVLLNNDTWQTKSFLSNGRLLLENGSTIQVPSDNVINKALLVPDAELQEASFNQIFTSQDFCLYKVGKESFSVGSGENWWEYQTFSETNNEKSSKVKLTAVPKETKLKTNGTDYFSSTVGSAEESFKTEDVKYVWNKTKPQILTTSSSLIRGQWGYYVGMSDNDFEFGDVVTIKKKGFYDDEEVQNLLEFQTRFNDLSFFSPISERFSVDILMEDGGSSIEAFCGDCFPSMFTHRMMTNFIDPELPTNTKIINPSCWCENYAVRCTAEILSDTHSNLTGDSAGFYIPSPPDKTGNIVSLIFGVLTGNLPRIIKESKALAEKDRKEESGQDIYANEVAQAFEIYTGNPSPSADNYNIDDDDAYSNGQWDQEDEDGTLAHAAKTGKIKKVDPKEMEKNASGINIKALFKSDDKWEMHGTAQINRADVNAVSFGQWITFCIRSSMNLALRDIDFNQATEEARFNKKRSFFPLEKMDPTNKLLDSNVINAAAKKTIHKNSYPVYKTVPFIKQEYFNRIYWSKPNIAESFLNSFRMVYTDQYKEYNKEFGDITKILPLGNSLFVAFDHGLGTLPVNRTVQTESEASPYLPSRNVLPAQINTLSKDFGSMWKNSIIITPKGLIYGVDTVGKKIWRTNGQQVEFISDHKVTKFLNDYINLSEFDYKAYQGHLDVKTHYNNFKNDVIFTLIKDKPKYKIPSNKKISELHAYIQDVWGTGKQDDVVFPPASGIQLDEFGNAKFNIIYGHIPDVQLNDYYTKKNSKFLLSGFKTEYDSDGNITNTPYEYEFNSQEDDNFLQIKTAEIQNGKIYINDIFTGIWCDIDTWEPGTVWSMCYNETLQKWTTFYDWYPIESCNVDNIYFSFDQEQIDKVYENKEDESLIKRFHPTNKKSYILNKYFIDQTFTDTCDVFDYTTCENIEWDKNYQFASYYCEKDTCTQKALFSKVTSDEWEFKVFKYSESQPLCVEGVVTQIKFFNLPNKEYKLDDNSYDWNTYASDQSNEKKHLQFYDIRDYNPNRMYLWKHGQAGLYDNQGKIKPTYWYGQQHEFNFEFVVNELPQQQKIFNNLKLISNKTTPDKFEFEIVGEGYEWFEHKPIVEWINKKTVNSPQSDPDYWWKCVLNRSSQQIIDGDKLWPKCHDFPSLFDKNRIIYKLPYLKMKHTDKKGSPERPHYKWDNGTTYWSGLSTDVREDKYSYNCSEPCFVEDDQLNETRIRTEQLGNDVRKYGRIRGNMQYFEDLWNVEIRPIKLDWCYIENEELKFKKLPETRHRDKYIKVKVRYSGEDLALIQAILTTFNESYS